VRKTVVRQVRDKLYNRSTTNRQQIGPMECEGNYWTPRKASTARSPGLEITTARNSVEVPSG